MQERKAWHVNGFLALLLSLVMFIAAIVCFASSGSNTESNGGFDSGGYNTGPNGGLIFAGILLLVLFIVTVSSLTVVQPNEAKVLTFFGRYLGTVLDSGIWMVAPFTKKTKVSRKVRNFNSMTLKVNDAEGNPIEIAAVIVFRVFDTAKAKFEVDQYEKFVEIQSETAVRHIAAQYPYDTYADDSRHSLRGNADEVAAELMRELQNRLVVAGVEIIETRLTHLAYSPEIASAMLQRQQAAAIVSARQIIVEGAVGMVEMALIRLAEKGIELDDERRAAMINNLMVSIVSDRAATPVINTGTLYS